MSPKIRYTKPPTMTEYTQAWCDGPACDLKKVEHTGDGWQCENCGTFWHHPEDEGQDAKETWGEDIEGLPLYDEDGNKVEEA